MSTTCGVLPTVAGRGTCGVNTVLSKKTSIFLIIRHPPSLKNVATRFVPKIHLFKCSPNRTQKCQPVLVIQRVQ